MAEVKKRTVYCLTKKVSDENYDVYVRSTSIPLSRRLRILKCSCQQGFCGDNKLFARMREVGVENWTITALFQKTCTKDEIRRYEGRWVDILEADLNTFLPINESDHQKSTNAKHRRHRMRNVVEKKYFCEVCEKAFQEKWSLTQHENSLKHQYAYLNSLD